MSTAAQIEANRENAQHSTGPTSEEGKAVSCKNRYRYGFTGVFAILDWEDEAAFDYQFLVLYEEYRPETATEKLLIQKMAQHQWLSQRAIRLQTHNIDDPKQFALFLRYQTTNDRGFSKCLNDLLKLRAEKRKAQIGFESQKAREAAQQATEGRKESAEKRREELHQWALALAEAKVDYQQTLKLCVKVAEEERSRVQRAA